MFSRIINRSIILADTLDRRLSPIDNRIARNDLAIYVLLITCSSKWIYEGLLAFAALQVFFILIGVLLILLKRKSLMPLAESKLWLFFIFSLFANVIISGGTLKIFGRAILSALIIAYALYLDCDSFDVKRAIGFLTKIGIFHSLMVLLHLVLKGPIAKYYFPLLNPIDYEYAMAYHKDGYYFGVLTSPHEVAGLITFSIMSIVFWNMASKNEDKRLYCLAGFLLVPLLLTGKKAIFCFAIISIAAVVIICFISEKQWKKVYILLGAGAAGVAVLVLLIMLFPDNALFSRFHQLFLRLIHGKSLDNARKHLYEIAILEWSNNKIFGIGWRQFRGLTTTVYNFQLGHQVNCDYLQWLCEMGIVGFVLNMIPLVVTWYRTVIICRNGLTKISDEDTKWAVLFAVGVQIFISIYAIIEVPFYDIMFFSVYFVSCIIINSAWRKMKKGKISFSCMHAEC